MDTLIISGADFASVKAAVDWANNQIGRSAPNNTDLEVVKILEFQIVPVGDSFSIAVLVEVERKKSMSSMVINMRKDLGLSQSDAGE